MKQRVISAIVALLITIPFILLGGIYFRFLIIIFGILSLREITNVRRNIPLFMKCITYILFLIFIINGFELVDTVFSIDISLIVLTAFVLFMPIFMYKNKEYNVSDAILLFSYLLFFSLVFNSFIIIRDSGLMLTVYLLSIPILTDTFALFGGMKYGRHKLLPSISPNKSEEGLVIGVVACTILSSLFYYFCVNSNVNIIILVVTTLLLSLIGEFGDLVFSAIKREYGIKDFSNIMPGHGGMLDRLDSTIFVILAYMIFISVL